MDLKMQAGLKLRRSNDEHLWRWYNVEFYKKFS
jgi:hypothetical protein